MIMKVWKGSTVLLSDLFGNYPPKTEEKLFLAVVSDSRATEKPLTKTDGEEVDLSGFEPGVYRLSLLEGAPSSARSGNLGSRLIEIIVE